MLGFLFIQALNFLSIHKLNLHTIAATPFAWAIPAICTLGALSHRPVKTKNLRRSTHRQVQIIFSKIPVQIK